ncbi:MAG: putative rane protein [Acidimicrobiales bacterium]|nr:putative rane protein [Acidimicrobiales bacterium]
MTPRRQLLLSLAGLACIYAVFIGVGDSRAWSGSDAGGKVATIRFMDQHHTLRPVVGYWAERWDPRGDYHPLVYTSRIGGNWVQVTTLPFVYAGLPLWRIAGRDGILVLPVAGSLLAAYAARRLARALGARSGLGAFWLVGLGSPMLFYAADFWEHSMAVGLALLSVALLFEGGERSRFGPLYCGLAGLAAGFAATMRTEILVYVAALAVAVLVVSGQRSHWLRRPWSLLAAAVGLFVPLVANSVVERAVFGHGVRDTRAAGNVASAGHGILGRLSDGALTAVGVLSESSGKAYVLGAALVLTLVIGAAWTLRRDVELRSTGGRASAAAIIALYGARFANGLGFVPGFIPAAPAGAAAVAARGDRARVVMVAAVVSLPLVWLFSWQGQLVPQWGGRYVLVSGALLTVLGAVAMEEVGWRRPAPALIVTIALAVSLSGAAWHVRRTRAYARAIAAIEQAPRDVVVVSHIVHLGREAGSFYGDHRWLSAGGSDGVARAASIVRDAGATQMDVVDLDRGQVAPNIAGWQPASARHVGLLGFRLAVWRYRLAT